MTLAQAQELLDRNAETIAAIVKLQEESERPGGRADALARKEKLMARLHRRLLKLARWQDAPHPERFRADMEQEAKEQKALELVLMNGRPGLFFLSKHSCGRTGVGGVTGGLS